MQSYEFEFEKWSFHVSEEAEETTVSGYEIRKETEIFSKFYSEFNDFLMKLYPKLLESSFFDFRSV